MSEQKQGDGKVVLVTGSSSGIGEATVKLFASRGFRVAVCGLEPDQVERVAAECAQLGSRGPPLKLALDFRQAAESGATAVARTVEHFGRLDVLINNAGVFEWTPCEADNAYERYQEIMAVNTDSIVKASLAACKHLKETNGCLLFVSCVGGLRAHGDSFAYCMSKTAVSMLAKCLAIDLAPRVRVNVVSPGPVKSNLLAAAGMTPEMISQTRRGASDSTLVGRLGEPNEVASLLYYLASDEAAYISGQDFVVDGGYTLKLFSSVHSNMK